MAGKLDSRQKMINMMYLVFIAMLALNIGKEVLATIGILNDDLQSSITQLHDSSKEAYGTIQSNATSLDYKIAASKVTEMQDEADTFFNFIQGKHSYKHEIHHVYHFLSSIRFSCHKKLFIHPFKH